MFIPIWGRWTHFDSYFSNGLKPPTRLDQRGEGPTYFQGLLRQAVFHFRGGGVVGIPDRHGLIGSLSPVVFICCFKKRLRGWKITQLRGDYVINPELRDPYYTPEVQQQMPLKMYRASTRKVFSLPTMAFFKGLLLLNFGGCRENLLWDCLLYNKKIIKPYQFGRLIIY